MNTYSNEHMNNGGLQKTVAPISADDIMPKGAPPLEEDYYALANLYKMFADPTRLKIIFKLYEQEGKEPPLRVNDLAEALSMSPSAVSHQLATLRLANLVHCKRQGKEMSYSLADSHVVDITRALWEKGMEHIYE
ncbi:MAG: metalloregulator ArsR/SmtB family transcription factor [Spirochaetaceae bacterium]|jgi:ArsR family transcriptional regulator|nr:metalloregulator ArsR/SmtB family transcription factor [Spirochaetaceae bacterium]